MSEKNYGILLLSFSKHSHQSSFVPLYQQNPRTRIVAVADEVDIEPELKAVNQEWAQKLEVPYIEGVDCALERTDVDVLSIGHEIERRADLALRGAAAGKHLWIDKFIGATIDECDAVVKGVEEAGVKSIIPSYIYGELVRQSRAVLESGRLGDLLGLHADIMFGKGWPRPIPSPPTRDIFLPPGRWKFPDIKRELLTVGAYSAGLIQQCLGPISHVYGQAGAYFFPEHAAHRADDFGTLTMTDKAGRIATLCAGRIGVAAHALGGPLQTYLIGTRGNILIDAKSPRLDTFLRHTVVDTDYQPSPEDYMQWHSGPPVLGATLMPDNAGLEAGLEEFVQALDEDRSPTYTVREARDNMEILIAGYLSVVRGKIVELPLEREAS